MEYEIGLAHCQKKPVILLTTDPSTLKFDLRDHRTIVYDPEIPTRIRDELVRTMKAALTSDPDQVLESAFASSGKTTLHQATDKAVETVIQEARSPLH